MLTQILDSKTHSPVEGTRVLWRNGYFQGKGKVDESETSYGRMSANRYRRGLPGGALDKRAPDNAGDVGSILGLGRSHMPPSN